MFPDMYRRPLEAVQAAAVEVVLPLFRAMVDAAESIILKLHEVCTRGSCPLWCLAVLPSEIAASTSQGWQEKGVHPLHAGGWLGRRYAKGTRLWRRAARLSVHDRADAPPGALPVSPHVYHLLAYASCKASQ
jgi:hypothetical protein